MLYTSINIQTNMSIKTFPTERIKSTVRTILHRVAQIPFVRPAVPLARKLIQHIKPRHLLLAGAGTSLLVVFAYTASFYWPKTIDFSYSTKNCITNPVILPGVVSPKHSPTFSARLNSNVKLANFTLYSHITCITPNQVPKEQTLETIDLSVAGSNFLKKKIHIQSGTSPTAKRQAAMDAPVPTNEPLVFTFDQADLIFEYQLSANGQSVNCSKQDRTLHCGVTGLKLGQTKKYQFTLRRTFNHKADRIVFEKELTTVEEVRIVTTDVKPNQTVYNIPQSIILELNRAAVSINSAKVFQIVDKKRQELPTTASISGTKITLGLDKPLPRSAKFEIEVKGVTAADKGFLDKPFLLPFQTSGGPKTLGVSTGGSKLHPSGSVSLTFDSKLSGTQSPGDFIQIFSGNVRIPANITPNGRVVTIKPISSLPRCSSFTVKVLDGLQNEFGVTGESSWQYNGQVLCQSVFSIGTSVLGRGITAYSFGSGAGKIVFVGTTHGDEQSSTYLLNNWVSYLESNAHRIPKNRTIVVIPNLNPDGFASSRRTNAHNVDLNRNFPANDWKQSVTMPGGSINPSGGGSAPLSEPESRALANYVLGQAPQLVLTYHATGGVVVPNDSGNSRALAGIYDQQSNVYHMSNSASKGFFNYDTTGAFEDWLYDKVGIPCLLIELWTKTGYEFSGHTNAMWSMIQ